MAYDASASSGPAPPAVGRHVVVVGSQFTAPYPMDLTVTKKLMTPTKDSFAVYNANGDVMFRIKGSDSIFSNTRLLVNNGDHPVVCLRPKKWSAHRKWQIFKRDSKDPKDLLLTVKKSSRRHSKNEVDVFLAENTKQNVPDFIIKGSWSESSWTIYLGNFVTIIAQTYKKQGNGGIFELNDQTFLITVNPNVDYVFILALLMTLDEINEENKGDALLLTML